MADADLVLLLLDATATIDADGMLQLPEDDARLLASLQSRGPLVVVNKIDLARPARVEAVRPKHVDLAQPAHSEAGRAVDAIGALAELAQVSALTGEGIDELRAKLLERVRGSNNDAEGGMLTSLRHYEALARPVRRR